jgi:hypothetical protein
VTWSPAPDTGHAPDTGWQDDTAVLPRTPPAEPNRPGRRQRALRSPYIAVVAAIVAFAAICLGFLLNTPTLIGPDEPYHFDRIIAAEHGRLAPAPGKMNVSAGGRSTEHAYVYSQMRRGGPSQAEFTARPRDKRPSLNALGGDTRSPDKDVANYETQHPPLYYDLIGAVVKAWPGADGMAADKLVLLVRLLNVLMVLPLPLLFFLAARRIFGDNPVSRATAFAPLLVPGLARGAATINNDNLAIVVGAAATVLAIRIMMGDRSLRTAILVSLCCVAGSLTKATIVFALLLVPAAYVIQVWQSRRLPSRSVIATLVLGAIASGAWWVHNYVAYGAAQPNAWGSQSAAAQGRPRGNIPIDYDHFWWTLNKAVLSRFWGALGLHEPPQLPLVMINLLSVAMLACAIAAIIVVRGLRWQMALLIAVPVASQLMVILQSYMHYRHYLAIPGLQGRYVYPGVFGVLLPFALGAALLLYRWARWAPLVILTVGLLASTWALYTSVEYTWLHRGESLRPNNWGRAYNTLAEFFPLSRGFTDALAVLGGVFVVVAIGLAVWSCVAADRTGFSWRQVRQPDDTPTRLTSTKTFAPEPLPS